MLDSVDEERRFFDDLGWQLHLESTLQGPELEHVVGLPPGATLRFQVMADPANNPTRIELTEFTGVPAVPRHTRPVGIRRVTIAADRATVLTGPAGLEVELRPATA
jgi:hypothetical protein